MKERTAPRAADTRYELTARYEAERICRYLHSEKLKTIIGGTILPVAGTIGDGARVDWADGTKR